MAALSTVVRHEAEALRAVAKAGQRWLSAHRKGLFAAFAVLVLLLLLSAVRDVLHEVRYEDLVADPEGELRLLYERLGLGDFGPIADKLEVYRQRTKDYQTNRFELGTDMRSEIDRRWGPFMRRYGYCGGETASIEAPATSVTTR